MVTKTRDRIEKEVVVRAPRSRVWRALTDSKEFGAWFQALLEGPFQAGQPTRGRITYPGYEHLTFQVVIEAMEPERYFSFRWHPNAIEPGQDYSQEPMTLVEFTLEEVEGGTRIRLVESGFEGIPLERRAEALKQNDGGWTEQMKNIERYVEERP